MITILITILRRRIARNIWVATLKVKVTTWPCSTIVPDPQLRYLKSDFKTNSQKWSPYWDDVSRATFGSLPWRSRSQHDLSAKSCPAHNFIIWSRISKIFYRMITILIRRVARKFGSIPWRSRSQLDLAAKSCPAHNFVIWSQILTQFRRNDHHIETTCHVQHLGRYIKGQVHSMTLKQNHVRPKTLLFEVGF